MPRLIQFSIRDVIWLMLTVSLFFGWGVYAKNMRHSMRQAETKAEKTAADLTNANRQIQVLDERLDAVIFAYEHLPPSQQNELSAEVAKYYTLSKEQKEAFIESRMEYYRNIDQANI